jgi:hypothetical protein
MALTLLLPFFNDSLVLFDCWQRRRLGRALRQRNQRGDAVTLGTLPSRRS